MIAQLHPEERAADEKTETVRDDDGCRADHDSVDTSECAIEKIERESP